MRVQIDRTISTPAYRQIAECLLHGIEQGQASVGDALPPVAQIMADCGVARETVLKAYRLLKTRGLVAAHARRGYYVASESVNRACNVMLLFDAFTPYKQVLYNALRAESPENTCLDIYFHHFNPDIFQSLLRDSALCYDAFIVMPFPHASMKQSLTAVPAEKLLLLDRSDAAITGRVHIWQDFGKALDVALESALDRITKYDKFVLFFPPDRHHPASIPTAFRRFCRHAAIRYTVQPRYSAEFVKRGSLLFAIEDDDLVSAVVDARNHHLTVGRDVGILSYNDTPIKQVVGSGIDVVSIDFAHMGALAARWLQESSVAETTVPTRLVARGSV